MSNRTLPNLPAAAALSNADLILVNNAGNPRKQNFTGVLDPTSAVYINSFFDGVNFTAPTCILLPLSTWFGSLGAAQVYYPYATSLSQTIAAQPMIAAYANLTAAQVDYPDATAMSDEAATCCWRRAIRTIYERAIDAGYTTENVSCGLIICDGTYVTSEPIVNYLNSCQILGVAGSFIPDGVRQSGESSLQLIGAAGTLDVPRFCLENYAMNEFGQPPSGIPIIGTTLPMPAGQRQDVTIKNLTFNNTFAFGNMDAPSSLGYRGGLRSRMGGRVQLSNINLIGSVWDGIVLVAPRWVIVDTVNFGGCYRDGLAIQDLVVSRSVTGITKANPAVVTYSGADCFANGEKIKITAVSGMTQVNGNVYTVANVNTGANTFELSGVNSTGYSTYTADGTVKKTYDCDYQQFYCEFGNCGRASVIIDMTNANYKRVRFDTNSYESISGDSYIQAHPTWYPIGCSSEIILIECNNVVGVGDRCEGSSLNGIWGNHLFIGCDYVKFTDGTIHNPTFATKSASGPYTTDALTYTGTYGRMDITDTRNYNAGAAADQGTLCNHITITKETPYLIKGVDGSCLGAGPHLFEDESFTFWSIPTSDGSYGKIVTNWTTAIPTWFDYPPNSTIRNGQIQNRIFDNFSSNTDAGGYRCVLLGATWAASTAYFATFNTTKQSGNFLTVRQIINPTVFNGYLFQCVVSGTSGGSEPSWDTTIGNVTTDNTVHWKCVAQAFDSGENQAQEFRRLGQRIRYASAAPTIGYWQRGSIIMNSAPASAGNVGWGCVTAGVPGTWKTFGTIA